MSIYDKDLQVGDLITAYHSGYHIVTNIERRFLTKNNVPYSEPSKDINDREYNALITYERIFDGNFKRAKSKITKRCSANYCNKVTLKSEQQSIENQIKELKDNYKKLEEFFNSGLCNK